MRTPSGWGLARPGDFTGLLTFGALTALTAWATADFIDNRQVAGAIVCAVLTLAFALGSVAPAARLLWRARVRTLTGMSPSEIERRGIDPATLTLRPHGSARR